MTAPSPFSATLPKLQIAWDSTSLRALMFCPRYYEYTIIRGFKDDKSVHLKFGGYYASAVEVFKKARLAGASRDDATLAAVKKVVRDTWQEGTDEEPDGHPWGGRYEEQWRCTGTEKYRNGKGNAAKCPWSHAGKWFPAPAPGLCGECGSPTEQHRRWVPEDTAKNRLTLIRTVEWYCEEQPELVTEGLHAYAFPNGTPAVELSFKIPLPWKAPAGEPYILAGHIDSMMTDGGSGGTGEIFPADNKTTAKWLGEQYWKGYSPNIQVDIYDLAGTLLWPDLPIKGFMIEAAQVLESGSRFAMKVFHRNEAQREETFQNIHFWLGQAERFADEGHWPMNTANCWLCPFAGVCSKSPEQRERYLSEFRVEHWNPLEER